MRCFRQWRKTLLQGPPSKGPVQHGALDSIPPGSRASNRGEAHTRGAWHPSSCPALAAPVPPPFTSLISYLEAGGNFSAIFAKQLSTCCTNFPPGGQIVMLQFEERHGWMRGRTRSAVSLSWMHASFCPGIAPMRRHFGLSANFRIVSRNSLPEGHPLHASQSSSSVLPIEPFEK